MWCVVVFYISVRGKNSHGVLTCDHNQSIPVGTKKRGINRPLYNSKKIIFRDDQLEHIQRNYLQGTFGPFVHSFFFI